MPTRQSQERNARNNVENRPEGANRSRPAEPADPRLAGLGEILDRLVRISRDGILEMTFRDDFPEPLAELVGGAVWDGDEVDAWIRSHPEELFDLFRVGSGEPIAGSF
jgi:prophage regulatory protein